MDDYDQGTTSDYHNDDIFDSNDEEEYSSKDESNSSEESSITEDSCEEEDSEEADPWQELIHEAAAELRTEYQELVENFKRDGFSEIEAKKQAFSEILPKLRKELGNVYSNRLEWMAEMKKDPIHQKIMETRKRFVKDDSFDTDEAMTAAIKKRKFLLQRMLQDRQHFSDNDDDEDETDVHDQFKKQLNL